MILQLLYRTDLYLFSFLILPNMLLYVYPWCISCMCYAIHIPMLIGCPDRFAMYNFLNACLGFAGPGEDGNSHSPHFSLAARLRCLKCFTLELPGEFDQEEETGAWGS